MCRPPGSVWLNNFKRTTVSKSRHKIDIYTIHTRVVRNTNQYPNNSLQQSTCNEERERENDKIYSRRRSTGRCLKYCQRAYVCLFYHVVSTTTEYHVRRGHWTTTIILAHHFGRRRRQRTGFTIVVVFSHPSSSSCRKSVIITAATTRFPDVAVSCHDSPPTTTKEHFDTA